jgi:hypothetical protein
MCLLVFLVNEEEYFNTLPHVEGGEGKPLKVRPMQHATLSLSHFTNRHMFSPLSVLFIGEGRMFY